MLKLIGAISDKEQVTKIGELLIKIPIEPFLSRAIVEGMMFAKILQQPDFLSKLKISPEEKKKLRN
jgi:HrpA-like RNA helicase